MIARRQGCFDKYGFGPTTAEARVGRLVRLFVRSFVQSVLARSTAAGSVLGYDVVVCTASGEGKDPMNEEETERMFQWIMVVNEQR